jgi:hypothetical protein
MAAVAVAAIKKAAAADTTKAAVALTATVVDMEATIKKSFIANSFKVWQ